MVLAAVLTLPGCDGGSKTPKIQTTVRPGVAPTPPTKGAYFGAWVDPARDGSGSPAPSGSPSASASPSKTASPSERARVDAVTGFERDMGRRLDIVAAYRSWKQRLPQDSDAELLSEGRYLLVTWSGTDTREIVAGEHDDHIRQQARAVKSLGKPVFLRWQSGMDADKVRDRVHSAGDFTAAWRHLREIFRREKADNVAWVWSPTAGGFRGGEAEAFYPGDDQVDWIAAEVYPGGTYDYRDFSEAARFFMDWADERPKPIMIPEFGVPRSYGERRAEWLRKTATYLQDPQVKAVVYYDSDEGGADESGERRYEYSTAGDRTALSALRELATTPYFNPRNLPVTAGE
ncbi:Glycosyl hydrolase family 26 [Thermomonospora echinospora]|uniref:Glycosyl hydrolase family 26 n=2 Tax=Thermomonospora echinospora TaxID=1992 RepID=A0A1H6AGY8_9ACTN|nr:Glycosyl hydrolase family 26 [Thermomonospora echinospora]